jgi:hypothetical protein
MNILKENIKLYLPAIINIVGDTDFDWKHIDKLFSNKLTERTAEANGGTLIVEATIYDMIIEAKKQNLQAMRLLSFFQRLLEDLSINLTNEEQKLIKKNVRDFLTRFDLRYLDYIGELAVINNLIKSKIYRLQRVESELSSKKKIDFEIKRIEDGRLFFVEAVNIHLDSNKVESDDSKIRKFLDGRLMKKMESKRSDTNFFLVPVIWGGWSDIKIYSEYFKKNKMHLKSILEPVSYLTFTDPNNEKFYYHRFGNVSKIFDSE